MKTYLLLLMFMILTGCNSNIASETDAKIIQYKDGSEYHGKLMNGKRNGYGMMFYPDGSTYVGEWNNDVKSGWGTSFSPDKKIIYAGHFQNNQYGGEVGVQKYYSLYSLGEWNGNTLNGLGMEYGNHDKYFGEFQGGIPDNYGLQIDKNNVSYLGAWNKGQKDGYGITVYSENKYETGIYKNDIINEIYASTLKEENNVCVKGDCNSGYGVMEYDNGDVYSGSFREGKRWGDGILQSKNGYKYDGKWYRNSKSGVGAEYYPNGDIANGFYKAGDFKYGIVKHKNGIITEYDQNGTVIHR